MNKNGGVWMFRFRSLAVIASLAAAIAFASSTAAAHDSGLRTFTWEHGAVSLLVPRGWSAARVGGANWKEIRFVNPRNPNEEIDIVGDGCPGCVLSASGRVTATSLRDSTAYPGDFGVRPIAFYAPINTLFYRFRRQDDPFPGVGVIEAGTGNWTKRAGDVAVQVLLPSHANGMAWNIVRSLLFDPAAITQ